MRGQISPQTRTRRWKTRAGRSGKGEKGGRTKIFTNTHAQSNGFFYEDENLTEKIPEKKKIKKTRKEIRKM